jgi:hypothetical protein
MKTRKAFEKRHSNPTHPFMSWSYDDLKNYLVDGGSMLDRKSRMPALIAIACVFYPSHLHGGQAKSAVVDPMFPGFKVSVTLSQKAGKTLSVRKETIIVDAEMTGSPKPGTPRRLVSDMGEIGLSWVRVEIAPGAVAEFGPAKLDQQARAYIDKSGPQLLINVYSGRKSSKDNLLDCGIYEGPLDAVQKTTIPITCKLIAE